MSRLDELRQRYLAAAHAVQSGVAMEHARGSDDGSPKHLRTGVNLAMAEQAALARLLVRKGIISEEEYFEAMVEAVEGEKTAYEDRLSAAIGGKITLG